MPLEAHSQPCSRVACLPFDFCLFAIRWSNLTFDFSLDSITVHICIPHISSHSRTTIISGLKHSTLLTNEWWPNQVESIALSLNNHFIFHFQSSTGELLANTHTHVQPDCMLLYADHLKCKTVWRLANHKKKKS